MKHYSKKQLQAISYAVQARQRLREEHYLKSVGEMDNYKAQTKYKTMRGYINHITGGKYYEVIKS